MARIRTIKPEFWTSEQVVECSTNARLLFIGMWNFCDDGGIMPANARTLKMRVFPGDEIRSETIRGMVDELIRVELIAEYEVENITYWGVTGWSKHQRVDKPSLKFPAIPKDHSATGLLPFDDRSPPESNGMEGSLMEGSSKNGTDDFDIPPNLDRRGDTKPPSASRQYRFEGKVIRLTEGDFGKWERSFPNLSLEGELIARDAWLSDQSPAVQKKWFNSTSAQFAKLNRETGARGPPGANSVDRSAWAARSQSDWAEAKGKPWDDLRRDDFSDGEWGALPEFMRMNVMRAR
jgi:hypothetical protein